MADIALGYAMATAADPPISAVTSHLSADFAGSAKLGDWVHSQVDIQKIGRTLCFANVYLLVGANRIVRASGVFAVTAKDQGNLPTAKTQRERKGRRNKK